MKERILLALEVADKYAFAYKGGDQSVPEEEQAILDKWVDIGLIAYTNKKKGKMSRLFYFPVLESKEWDGLSGGLWLKVMWHVMRKHGIESGLSSNSVSEYINRQYKYNLNHKVQTSNYVGKKQTDQEDQAWKEILEEEENGQ